MKLHNISFILCLASTLAISGCASDETSDHDWWSGTGGSSGTAGSSGTGGQSNDAGPPETGGASGDAGTSGSNGDTGGTGGSDTDASPNLSPYLITSPYAGVDWVSSGQYKASLHSHTSNSDGSSSLANMLEDMYSKDYDIIAITDHDYLTVDWVHATNGLTQSRFDAMAAGVGRGGRGMLQIPYTIEQSRGDHVNTYLANYNNKAGQGNPTFLEESIAAATAHSGISRINHPGRYTGADVNMEQGAAISNNPAVVKKYVDLFMGTEAVGMEIINKRDGESLSDRILWDNILTQTIPQGRYVWGFSEDDTHSTGATGYSFNVFLQPENTLEHFSSTMHNGVFYAVAKVAKRELGAAFVGSGPTPVVRAISIDESTACITITAEHTNKIQWISRGTVVAESATICIDDTVDVYVRANLSDPGSIAFTQPFGVSLR